MSSPISVTIMTGSFADATSRVCDRLLQATTNQRVTAILPKRSRKKSRVIDGVSIVSTTERLMRLGEGCACCTVRSDLMTKVQKIAEDKTADHIVIQALPQSDLRTLAKTFTVADRSGAVLSEVARIEGFVSVIDVGKFLEKLQTSAGRAQIESIELANVIVVTGGSGVPSAVFDQALGVIAAVNPTARVERADEKSFSLASLGVQEPFKLDVAEQRAMDVGVSPQNSEATSSVTRFVYQARRPFHPARLHAVLNGSLDGVIRAQGSFWVATRPEFVRKLDLAGGTRESSCTGMWWATVPEGQRPDSLEFKQYAASIWHPEYGDRHQALSFVGVGLDEANIRALLDECLLNEQELVDPEVWATMQDPFDWPEMSQ